MYSPLKATLLSILTMTLLGPGESLGEQPDEPSDQKKLTFFENRIRPVLARHCYECHSGDQAESGLRVDLERAIRRGGDRGPAIVPDRPDASLLLTAISHGDVDLKMPPDQPRLPKQTIEDFRKWISDGAIDPRDGDDSESKPTTPIWKKANNHWAYQAIEKSALPVVKNTGWVKDEIDRFILANLEENGLAPTRDATPRVLLRRLTFDLLGLPPQPNEIRDFETAISNVGIDKALATTVDRLLESDQFGVRWGRHWLDVARYGESSGGESNISFPHAWRYRDYVIDAVNDDVPYDRFLTEQIAGDLLPFQNESERAKLLIATGFLAVGTKNLGENNVKKFQADIIDEQIDSLSRGVMASSIACARCHHHKFDPFSMEDYYALAGIFASTKTFFGTSTSPANRRSGDPLVLPRLPGQAIYHKSLPPKRFDALKQQFAELDEVRRQIKAAQQARFAGKKPERDFTLREVLANIWRIGGVEGKLETLDEDGNALPLAMGVLDAETIVDVPLLARGEIGREGEIVKRRLPSVIAPSNVSISKKQSGRLELAQWLIDEKNPLTARVFVNRVWSHLFGTGLVATADNFGTTGETPSHPELLDHLAIEFMNQGWSLKKLVRRLVRTRTYRQASLFDKTSFVVDPDNRLLWRMPKQRLDAEAIRDAMLSIAGEIDLKRPGGSHVARIIGDRPISLIGLNKKLPKDLDGVNYRSVYLPVIRDRLPDVLDLFDFAEPSMVTGQREITNVPLQSLYLMNSPFIHARSLAFASRLRRREANREDKIRWAFELCFGRLPDEVELDRSHDFLKSGQDRNAAWNSFCQSLLCTAEFRNLD